MIKILEIFTLPFMLRAIIVGSIIALCASLLGVSLVLKRYSMIGDGLSHVAFGALAFAAAMNVAPLWVALPVVAFSAFFLLNITRSSKVKGDAAIALISTGALAIGIIIVSLNKNVTFDVSGYMFGSILAMSKSDVILSIILSVIVLVFYIIFYNRIFAVTFDEDFAKASGIGAPFYNMLIAILTAVTVVLGMRLMGTLLISSLIIFPAVTSMQVFKSFKSVVCSCAVLSVTCFFIGVCSSYFMSTPTGPSVVVVNIIAFVLFFFIGKTSKIKTR